jgi:hypothetical protein
MPLALRRISLCFGAVISLLERRFYAFLVSRRSALRSLSPMLAIKVECPSVNGSHSSGGLETTRLPVTASHEGRALGTPSKRSLFVRGTSRLRARFGKRPPRQESMAPVSSSQARTSGKLTQASFLFCKSSPDQERPGANANVSLVYGGT